MIDSDKPMFVKMLVSVAAVYAREMTAGVIELYWHALSEYDIAAVRQAFDRHVKNPDTGQFMPKPADLIRMMVGSTVDSAMIAWAKVDKTVRRVGTYRDVVFDDALIHRVVYEMGGWSPLGTKKDDEWPFVAKEFQTRYRSYRSRNESPPYPPVLVGIARSSNSLAGMETSAPILVGDAALAERVRRGGANGPLIEFTQAASLAPENDAPRLHDR